MPAKPPEDSSDLFYLLLHEYVQKGEYQERIRALQEDIEKTRRDAEKRHLVFEQRLQEVEDKILGSQQEGYKRIITIQAAILLAILTTMISIAISFVFNHGF